jgi:hypothetical protein
MSDTEETEYLSLNSSISSSKKSNKIINDLKEENIPFRTIEIISDLFNNICEENKDKSQNINNKINPFLTINIPSMSIKDYLLRLAKFARINESTLIITLIYIDRICKINNFKLNFKNIYKLIISSMIVAIKYNEDYFYSTEVYAKLGGLTVKELKYLEFQFLVLIKFCLFVEKELFDKYNNNLINCDEENENESSEDFEYENENEQINEKGN